LPSPTSLSKQTNNSTASAVSSLAITTRVEEADSNPTFLLEWPKSFRTRLALTISQRLSLSISDLAIAASVNELATKSGGRKFTDSVMKVNQAAVLREQLE